jgi:hypothetical protein
MLERIVNLEHPTDRRQYSPKPAGDQTHAKGESARHHQDEDTPGD